MRQITPAKWSSLRGPQGWSSREAEPDNAAEWMQRDYVIMRKLSLLFQVRVRLPVHETYLFVERYGPATYKAHGV